MTSVKTTTTEIITIEEAIHDYMTARKDYDETIQKANKYYQHDKEVLEAQLGAYFKEATNITICGKIAYITYYGYRKDILEVIDIMEEINCDWSVEIDSEQMTVVINLFEGA